MSKSDGTVIRWRLCGAEAPKVRQVMLTPCGWLEIQAQGEIITGLAWESGNASGGLSPSLDKLKAQLAAYFRDPTFRFEGTLAIQGTAFCRKVWQALLAIPPGTVRTYAELARQLESFPRAVAAACRANPYPILIPCHRVVAKTGLGGYCGQSKGPALAIKYWLLKHEGWADDPALCVAVQSSTPPSCP
jgi:methylated-DNA-[protein]-cysteine S-methyltransferase